MRNHVDQVDLWQNGHVPIVQADVVIGKQAEPMEIAQRLPVLLVFVRNARLVSIDIHLAHDHKVLIASFEVINGGRGHIVHIRLGVVVVVDDVVRRERIVILFDEHGKPDAFGQQSLDCLFFHVHIVSHQLDHQQRLVKDQDDPQGAQEHDHTLNHSCFRPKIEEIHALVHEIVLRTLVFACFVGHKLIRRCVVR
jgi:hypothetical protein